MATTQELRIELKMNLKRKSPIIRGFNAERARFELAVAVSHYDGLANRWFQPLTHLSVLKTSLINFPMQI
jgi:hypothetical protein